MKRFLSISILFLCCLFSYGQHDKVNVSSEYIILNGDSIQFTASEDSQIVARIDGKWINWTPDFSELYSVDSIWFVNQKLYIRQGDYVDSTVTISTFTTADEIDPIYAADSADIVMFQDTIPDNGIATKADLNEVILDKYVNSYMSTVTVNDEDVIVTYPNDFSTNDYLLIINAWYEETIGAKTVRINNAVYDFTKTVGGFTLKVDTVAGYVEYFAADTVSLYPLIFTRGYSTLTGTTPTITSGYDGQITLEGATVLTIDDPDNGEYGDILVTQGASNYTLTITPTPKVINSGSGVVEISSGAGAITIVSYKVLNNTIYVNYGQNYD